MSSVIYDATNPLTGNGVAGFDLVVIDHDISASDPVETALSANEVGHLLIRKSRVVTGANNGIQLTGPSTIVTNEGTIQAADGSAIAYSGGGALTLTNFGTISSAQLAVLGNAGKDRIVNVGTLTTTSAVLLDLAGGDDVYDGIFATAADGVIKLGQGNDTAYGGKDSEIFSGGEGSDYLDGGAGSDTVDYSDATGGVSVDLSRTTTQAIGGGQGTDTLLNIENVIGSGHNDTLIGSTGNNSLRGGDGDDMLESGQGSDTLDGGSGNNTARYTGSSAKVDLRIQGAQSPQSTGHGSDTLIGITNLEGGSGADSFIGNDVANKLVGGSGSDTLTGGGGNDTLDGGSGEDRAEFSGARAAYTVTHNADGSVTIADTHTNRDGTDTLKDIRLVKFADQTIALTNRAASNISLSSTSISESTAVGTRLANLYSSDPDGDDLFYSLVSSPGGYFGLGPGGEEIVLTKALDYEAATEHTVTVKVHDKYGGEFTKTFTISVRNAVETTPLVRFGTAKAETVTGESGHDRLSGLGGNDQLSGQIGNDTLIGGTGNDTLFGGDGKDVFVFDQKPGASNRDAIADFVPVDDVVHLSRKVFSKLSKGTLSSKAFVIGDQFKDKDDRVQYLKKAGALFYDPDGSGSAKAIQFASITKNLKITHKDFFVI